MNVPCPRCQKPMSVPQPLPERIKCPSCGAVINTKKKDGAPPPANPQSAPPPPAPTPPAPANPHAAPPPAPTPTPPAPTPPPPANPQSAPPPPAPTPPPSPAPPQAAQTPTTPTESNAATSEKWFYAEPGQQPTGPTTLAELSQLATAGKIHGQTNVFRESAPQWQPAANVAELQAVLQAAGTGDEFNLTVNELPDKPAPAAARSDSFLSKMHSSMPKPVLFGIYGALGGLLGALIIGELCWLLFAPAPPDIAPMKIAVAPKVTIYPGGDFNTLPVKIARQKFEGPVKFQVEKIPEFVNFSRVVIPKEDSDGVFRVTAGPAARPNTYTVALKAIGGENGEHVVTKKIEVTVDPKPPILNVAAPEEIKVYVGGRNTLPFRIARDRFDGPVRLEVLDQPEGITIPFVEVAEPPQKRVGNKPSKNPDGRFAINAAKAKPGYHKLVIEARSLKNHKITAKTKFQLVVEPRPGKLRVAVSPKIVVYPGTKNKVTVKILRQDIDGVVQLETVNAEDDGELPVGVSISPVDVQKNVNQAVLVIAADEESLPDGKPVTHRLKLKAKVAVRDGDTASVTFPLTIQPPPPTLQLAVSPTVSGYPGGKATFLAKIARQRFDAPVRIQLRAANRYVSAAPVTIPAGKTDATIQLTINTAALALRKLPAKQSLSVTATSVSKKARATSPPQTVSLEILPPPSGLSLTVSPEVELYQKGKCKFFVKATRQGFVGPVKLKFSGAPKGVTFQPTVIPANSNSLEVTGQATLKTEPGMHKVNITAAAAKAPDGKTPTETADFTLNLKPFDPATRPPLDIVFVLDVSRSMDPQIKGIYDGIEQFLGALKKRELEARIGMVAFRDLTIDDDPMKTLQFDGKPFTSDYKAFRKEVGALKAEGGGDEPESSSDALDKAAKLPFRKGALKVFLLVTDAPNQKKPNSIPLPVAIKQMEGKKIDQVHLIVPKKHLGVYKPVHNNIKGSSFDLLKVGKTPEAFTSLLSVLSEEIATAIPGKEPKKPAPPPAPPQPKEPKLIASSKVPNPPAERTPAAPTPVAPQAPRPGNVDAIEPESPNPPTAESVAPPTPVQPKLQGVQSDQMFADEDRLQLLLATALWTAALAGGIALFLVSAQKRHLRHAWLSMNEASKTVGAGMIAGLAAGAVGQWFLQSASGASWLNTITQILAWGILGGLIGAGMGYVVPNVNRQRAFIGGCIGGFAGAVGFTLVSLLTHAILGRLIGAALLGLCLGIMVALVEMASRRYWLEIVFGEREIRTANLGPTTVAVGGDEKVASIYVPDAPSKAFGFRIDRNKVFCEDFVNGRTTEAAPGDTRDVGKVKLRVCSAESAVPTGATLQLVVARDLSLMDGMPLTVDDIPGLEPTGSDGIVALVSKRPRDPSQFLLRNRSKQPWTIIDAEGVQRQIGPGLSIELNSRCEIDFGQCKATLDPPKPTEESATTEASPPPQS